MFGKKNAPDLKDQIERMVKDAKERGEGAGQNFTTLEVSFGPDEHRNGFDLARQIEKVASEIYTDFNAEGPGVCDDCFWSALAAMATLRSQKATPDVSVAKTIMHIIAGVGMFVEDERLLGDVGDAIRERQIEDAERERNERMTRHGNRSVAN
jgi:hypothetical protein